MAQSLELKSLSLSNNFFGDEGIEVITGQVLTLMPKLKQIDICGNQITDDGLKVFFKMFVSGHQNLESFKINLNKIKENATGDVIKEAIDACPKLKEMSFKRC